MKRVRKQPKGGNKINQYVEMHKKNLEERKKKKEKKLKKGSKSKEHASLRQQIIDKGLAPKETFPHFMNRLEKKLINMGNTIVRLDDQLAKDHWAGKNTDTLESKRGNLEDIYIKSYRKLQSACKRKKIVMPGIEIPTSIGVKAK